MQVFYIFSCLYSEWKEVGGTFLAVGVIDKLTAALKGYRGCLLINLPPLPSSSSWQLINLQQS